MIWKVGKYCVGSSFRDSYQLFSVSPTDWLALLIQYFVLWTIFIQIHTTSDEWTFVYTSGRKSNIWAYVSDTNTCGSCVKATSVKVPDLFVDIYAALIPGSSYFALTRFLAHPTDHAHKRKCPPSCNSHICAHNWFILGTLFRWPTTISAFRRQDFIHSICSAFNIDEFFCSTNRGVYLYFDDRAENDYGVLGRRITHR